MYRNRIKLPIGITTGITLHLVVIFSELQSYFNDTLLVYHFIATFKIETDGTAQDIEKLEDL